MTYAPDGDASSRARDGRQSSEALEGGGASRPGRPTPPSAPWSAPWCTPLMERPAASLWAQMGLGKTVVTATAIRQLLEVAVAERRRNPRVCRTCAGAGEVLEGEVGAGDLPRLRGPRLAALGGAGAGRAVRGRAPRVGDALGEALCPGRADAGGGGGAGARGGGTGDAVLAKGRAREGRLTVAKRPVGAGRATRGANPGGSAYVIRRYRKFLQVPGWRPAWEFPLSTRPRHSRCPANGSFRTESGPWASQRLRIWRTADSTTGSAASTPSQETMPSDALQQDSAGGGTRVMLNRAARAWPCWTLLSPTRSNRYASAGFASTPYANWATSNANGSV